MTICAADLRPCPQCPCLLQGKGKQSAITADKAKELFDKLRGVLADAVAEEEGSGGECAICLEILSEEQVIL